jgi:hypothetical protein
MKAVFSTLFSGGGYFLWVQHNEIQTLEVKTQAAKQQETSLSDRFKKDESVQKWILNNEKILNENQVESDKAINEIIKALSQSVPENTDTRSRL